MTLTPQALAFLLPEDLATSDIVVVRPTGLRRPGSRLFIARPQTSTTPTARLHCVGFTAVGLRQNWPRALLPRRAGAEAKILLMPRSRQHRVTGRVLDATITRLPPPLLRHLGPPIVFASERRGVVEQALDELRPGITLGCSFGNADADRSRVAVTGFEGGRAQLLAKVRYERAARLQDREIGNLRRLAEMPALASTVPRLLATSEFRNGQVLVTDIFVGAPAPLSLESPLQRWLGACLLGEMVELRDLELVHRLQQKISAHPDLESMAESLLWHWGDVPVPTAVVHGDFTPWNVVIDHGEARVFDWEHGCMRGPAGWDDMHFVVQAGLVTRRLATPALVTSVLEHLRRREPQVDGPGAAVAALALLELRAHYRATGDALRERSIGACLERVSAHLATAPAR